MKRFENTYRFCDCDIGTFGSMQRKPKNWYGQCPKNYLLIVLNGEIVNLTLIIKKKYDQNSGIVYFIKASDEYHKNLHDLQSALTISTGKNENQKVYET